MRLTRRSAYVFAGMAALALAAGACRRAAVAPAERDALAAAVSTTLPFSARLSGGFAPSTQGPTRAAGDRPGLSPDTRIAIALLEKRAIESPTPAALADLGVAYLIQGDVDRAIATIEDAASQQTAAAPWSDLSAAYLVKADRTPARKIEYLARALEAAETSLKISRTNDALFNRALARDGLAPFTGTPAGWPEYAAAETNPAWRDTATRYAGADRPVDDVRDRWEARRKELIAKLQAGDAAFVKQTVRLFPEASIEFLEQEVMIDATAIASAELLASAIHDVTGDPMARDEVVALRARGEVLAQAHAVYAEGLRQYSANDLVSAERSFAAARDGFTAAGAPYRLWAEQQLTLFNWHEGRFEAANIRLARIERQARSRGYTTLLGRMLWQRGQVLNRQWRLTEGLAAFRESVSQHEAAEEREYAVSVYASLADTLRMLGEPTESWSYIGRTLEDLPRLRRPRRRYLLLYNAALFAARQDLHEAALLFQNAAVREAAAAGTDVLTEATLQRALVNIRRGDGPGARVDFDRAARQVASTPAGAYRSYISAELEIVRAHLGVGSASIAGLRDAIEFVSANEPGRVPGLYLLLARVAGAGAETALQSGIERLEAQQAGLGDEALRISYFDESWALFQDMVSLQFARKNPAQAFEYAERSRARTLLASAQRTATSRTRGLSEVRAKLPPLTVIVYYSVLADRVLIWTISSAAATFVERPIGERDLKSLVAQHRASIDDHREQPAANDRLYNLLIQPVAAALSPAAVVVLMPDGALQQLAFATLRHPSTRRYLVEDHVLMTSPSASFFVDARAAAANRLSGPLTSALLIGNPAAAGSRALPGAEAEVAAAANLYARHEVLTGRNATKQRFADLAPQFDVIHFGGHALVNPEFPLLSRLVFADQPEGEQSLFAHEIGRLDFPRTRVVVLAACSTAAGVLSRGEGVVSVARPFLGGGVPVVIASQWDVDDRATEQLTLGFHRALARSSDPIQALHAAQLAMLRSGDAVQALPASWGAFVAVGTTAR